MTWNSDSRAALWAALQALPAAALLLAAGPSWAAKAPAKSKFTLETPALSPFQADVTEATNFSFTVPGTGAASARSQTVERAFRFTPSGKTENRKALSIGVATRVAAASPERTRTLTATEPMVVTPRAYDVDVSLGWKGFAFNTGFSHSEARTRNGLVSTARDAVDVGVSYGGKNWRTSLEGTAEDRSIVALSPLERRYSVALGGAYMVAPRLSVTGGMRYRLGAETPSLVDVDRPDQSVYVGTNIAF
jgi:hypothetical protein